MSAGPHAPRRRMTARASAACKVGTPCPVADARRRPARCSQMDATTDPTWTRRLTAETFGTFALVFVAVGGDAMAVVSGGEVSVAARAVAPGLMVAALIYAIGDASGAHLNPVVSLAFALKRLFPVAWLLPYWASQAVGAIGAVARGPLAVRRRGPRRRDDAARRRWHRARPRGHPDHPPGDGHPRHGRPIPDRRTRCGIGGRRDDRAVRADRVADRRRVDEPGPLAGAGARHRRHRRRLDLRRSGR